jgi:hypothetical protein
MPKRRAGSNPVPGTKFIIQPQSRPTFPLRYSANRFNRAFQAHCTVSVTVAECRLDAAVPVTVTVYIPAGVPPSPEALTTPLLDLLVPPQADWDVDTASKIQSRSPSARLLAFRVGPAVAPATISPISGNHIA